jgi:putative AlgH/UPF0301 family transcriptional regulator
MKNKILIATKYINQTIFYKSIVFMIRENVGVILNINYDKYLTGARESIKESFDKINVKNYENHLRLGGLLGSPVICLHNVPKYGIELSPGLYESIAIKDIQEICIIPNACYKFYVGISGWDKKENQLQKEIAAGCWTSIPLNTKYLFNDIDKVEIWQEARKEYDKLSLEKININPNLYNKFTLN